MLRIHDPFLWYVYLYWILLLFVTVPEKNKPVKWIKSSLLFKWIHRLPPCLNITGETNTKEVVLMCKSKEPNTTPPKSNILISQIFSDVLNGTSGWYMTIKILACNQSEKDPRNFYEISQDMSDIKFFGGVGNAI